MSMYAHRTTEDVTVLINKIADETAINHQIVRDAHAESLGFDSIDELLQRVQHNFIIFDLISYTYAVTEILRDKYSCDINQEWLEATLSLHLTKNNECPELYKSLYQIDFKVVGYETECEEVSLSIADEDKETQSLSEFLHSIGIIEETNISPFGKFSEDIDLVYDTLDLSDDEIFSNDSLIVFGAKEDGDSCSSIRLLSGYGTLLVRSRSEEDIKNINQNDIYLIHNDEPEFYVCKIQLREIVRHPVSIVPSSLIDNLVNKSGEISEAPYDLSIVNWDKSLNYIVEDEGDFMFIFGQDGEFRENSDCFVSEYCATVNHEDKKITISSPSFMSLIDNGLDWDYCQALSKVPAELDRAFLRNLKFRDYSIHHKDTTEHISFSPYPDQIIQLYDLHDLLIEKRNIGLLSRGLRQQNPDKWQKTRLIHIALKNLLAHLSSVEEFIPLLKEVGVYSVSINHLVRHYDGDMVANSFAGYDKEGGLITVFQVRSIGGYTQNYSAIIDSLNAGLNGGAKALNELEYNWDTHSFDNNAYLDLPSVLELAGPITKHRIPYINLILDDKSHDVAESLSRGFGEGIDKSILESLFPALHIRKDKIAIIPPLYLPYSNKDEIIIEAIEAIGVTTIENEDSLRALRERMKNFYPLTNGVEVVLCMPILLDTTDADILELTLRHMFSVNGALLTPEEGLKLVGEKIGVPNLKAAYYTDSVNRVKMLGI